MVVHCGQNSTEHSKTVWEGNSGGGGAGEAVKISDLRAIW